jgi:FtsP/CotA-like multicopper oxidase with cupredoxin domain
MGRGRFLTLMGMAGLALAVVTLPWSINLAYGGPGGGTYYANSPAPDPYTLLPNASGTPIRKFIDSLAGLGSANQNNLGQYIPIAVADTGTYPGSDYYHLEIVDFPERMHTDLAKATIIRGYRDVGGGQPAHYLGPLIVAQRNRPVRLLVDNKLGTGDAGKLLLPVDTTLMGAGTGPNEGSELYTENRTSVHLHGGFTPWISDGTPHQWFTPAGETTSYPKGVSFHDVPDMPDPGDGSTTHYYPNQQSNRLQFYHEHAVGITRLGVYAGLAAGYLITDPVENDLIEGTNATGVNPGLVKVIPGSGAGVYKWGIPLIIQDKTFVPNNIGVQDALWSYPGSNPVGHWGSPGDFWFPHVYETNQDPTSITGANPFGRWDYGPWFWPPQPSVKGPLPQPTVVPESFMDTPVVNGTAYPYLTVEPKAYRFRILNASNDRFLNLQLYLADTGGGKVGPGGAGATATATVAGGSITGLTLMTFGAGYTSPPGVYITGGGGYGAAAHTTVAGGVVTGIFLDWPGAGYTSPPTVTIGSPTEVKMVPAIQTLGFPPAWPVDGRDGGVPDPATAGPQMIQIGTEGGFLPATVVLPNQPVNYEYDRRNIVVLNVKEKTLFLGPAERADVIIDFSGIAPGSKVLLYNDSPAPVPAGDPRVDYYTGNPDYTANGGAQPTLPGYGPNTRTIMQFRVAGTPSAPFDLAALNAVWPAAYVAAQDPPIVPQTGYPAPWKAATDTYARIQDYSITFKPVGSSSPKTIYFKSKAIQELFDPYGRMNATLGVELPFTTILNQTTLPFGYLDPPTEILRFGETQIWKITHNGVDTHPVHVHLFNVQVINRVGWDGAIRPPDPNELGWKETVRMNPLEDIIVALKPVRPKLSFSVPYSIRPLDPSSRLGSTGQFAAFDPLGNPVTTVNTLYNFGWEYVWHCHILGHEENDFMRAMVVRGSIPIGALELLLLD